VNVETIVIDASAALKWRLRDEEAVAEADRLQDDFLDGQLRLITPTLFDYEIANALKVAISKGRITEPDALVAIIDFIQYDIERHDFLILEQDAFQLALRYQRSVYDAAYLALAQAKGVDFYTGDKRLFNAVSNALTWVKWIGDY
jgi:predicted nucleic acid-binding protein